MTPPGAAQYAAVLAAIPRRGEFPAISSDDLVRLTQPGGGFTELRDKIADTLGLTKTDAQAVVVGRVHELTASQIEALVIQRRELSQEIARLSDQDNMGTD